MKVLLIALIHILISVAGAQAQTCSTQLAAVQAASATVQKDTLVYPTGLVSPNGSVTAAREKIAAQHAATLSQAVAALATCLATASPPPPPVNGFAASYWNTATPGTFPSTVPTVTRIDPTINFDWGTGSPDPAIAVDGFVARWIKTETFAAGSYVFAATVDDGVRLFLDGVVLIDQWIDQGPTTYTTTRTITAGAHELKVEYYENSGGAVMKLTYGPQPPAPGDLVVSLPGSLHVAWDAPPVTALASGPIGYSTFLDGLPTTTIPQATDPCPAGCAVLIPVTTAGPHTVAVTATRRASDGSLAQSAPASMSLTVRTP